MGAVTAHPRARARARARRAASAIVLSALLACIAPACGGVREDPELRRELLEMRDQDQAERTGEAIGSVETDRARAERLKEIVAEHGWPTSELVGADGASAAWLIAQHADHDVAFQQQALELMREAAADGLADPTEVAYLEDRVAVNEGRPQTYGTQIRCEQGGPIPSTPIADEAHVEERRAAAGLEPLEDYYATMREICAAEGEPA